MRGYARDGVVEQIRAAGGEIYAITSEPQRLADLAREKWKLAFETLGDPHHEIAEACRERGLLELFVNTRTALTQLGGGSLYSHPKGYFQPGVLALERGGRVLYRWRSRPTRRNTGGATERPTARHVFEHVSRARAEPRPPGEPADAPLDTKPELDSRGLPWPLFVSLLVANGWFVEARPFPYLDGGPSVRQRALRALLRIPLFVAGWAVAFTALPAWAAGAALVAWAVWITPSVRFVSQQFQNVPGTD